MEVGALVIIFALVVLFAFLGLGAWVTAKAVGAAKRGVDRTLTQARRTVEDTTLKAKSFGQVGVTAALAQLRLDLRTSMRATQAALYQGVQADASLKESIALFERLSRHGHELDEELKRLEQEPDRKRTAERLPGLRERTAKITESADSLRWAARDRARQFADEDLAALSAQIEVESGALRDWSRESVDDLAAAAAEWDAGAGRPAPGAAREAGHGRPASAGAREAAGRPALDASGPKTAHPWQKKAPRPEAAS
ncbi:copper transporter family protein [Streptomyces sp. NPDC001546]|uniref:copper transporter family protein n=1 Tax=Streptomyces sp. NPDC001546 TaxID=3364585 RepID=UPI0036BAEFBA